MRAYRDTFAMMDAVTIEKDLQLQELISKQIENLNEYEEPLSELIHILVIEPGDALAEVDAQLGFSLSTRPWDLVDPHSDWYEITIVVSDDGFGWVVYIPIHQDLDLDLRECCARHIKEKMT